MGLQSLDGVLDAKLMSSKHIVHNVFSVNKQGIVVLTNKAGKRGKKDSCCVADFFSLTLAPSAVFQRIYHTGFYLQ